MVVLWHVVVVVVVSGEDIFVELLAAVNERHLLMVVVEHGWLLLG